MNIEICANSIQSATNACLPGVTRIELCSHLDVGGLTPSYQDIDYCVHQLHIRTHVLIRPREGGFVYSTDEIELMYKQVEQCRSLGAHAIVVGFLTDKGAVDTALTRRFVELAQPMEVTFHRAFDELKQNPLEALEDIIGCGCDRILTSGLQPTAELGMETIHELVEHAAGRISIMPGGGITPTNVARIVDATGVNEVHGSCKTTLPDGTVQTDPKIVKQLINALSR